MDTTTVLTIINMIDTRISFLQEAGGEYHELVRLGEHLQDYIESQLNAAENQTGE